MNERQVNALNLLEEQYKAGIISISTLVDECFRIGQPKWISVEDKLPEHGVKVLTFTSASDDTEEQQRIITYGAVGSGFPSGVTHWTPLHEPPKQ